MATNFTGVTQPPAAIAVAAGWDRSLAQDYGKLIGNEAWATWGIRIEHAIGPPDTATRSSADQHAQN